MPIPKALAAKLAKRGLIKLNTALKEEQNNIHEEIIAEDYDENPQETRVEITSSDIFDQYQGWYACPNKWNVYHECSTSCQELWKGMKEIDKGYDRKRLKMLTKYPLSDHWREILDIGIGKYYYWNTETNLVSWLPPSHPKCQVSLSAADLRKNMMQDREKRILEEKLQVKSDEELSEDENIIDKKKQKRDHSDSEEIDSEEENKQKKRKRRTNPKREKEKVLDPMDPAAYSDCPRGNWASGLEGKNEAGTGVDTTASGQLFQMRPYPNPGSVLRANAASSLVGPKK